jgi:glycosyltransferase involved in cell wall biosynthesis
VKINKISIITPSLNQGSYIDKNINSILNQGYENFEHIIIDGKSNDNTLSVLKKYNHIKLISEKDKGQANAINKGFKLAEGDIIGWLNSDDVYMDGTFRKVNKIFNECPGVDFIFSHCLIINDKDEIVGFLEGKDPNRFSVLTQLNKIPQPTVFFRNNVFKKTGYLDEELFFAMDFDYWKKIAKNHKMMLVNNIFACFREHREAKSYKYHKIGQKEAKRSFFKHGGTIFTPYYFETWIKPKLINIFVYNFITRRVFFHGK